jgi:hypothetical protein
MCLLMLTYVYGIYANINTYLEGIARLAEQVGLDAAEDVS